MNNQHDDITVREVWPPATLRSRLAGWARSHARILTTALAFGTFWTVLGAASPAKADGLEVCNRTDRDISVAVAYSFSGTNNIQSNGWYTVDSDSCRVMVGYIEQLLLNSTYYLYATSPSGVWGGSYRLCLDTVNAFTINHADGNCGGYSSRDFRRISLSNTPDFEWDLTDN